MRSIPILAALAGLTWPTVLNAREMLHLQPSSKWVVEYADDSCNLARQFGEGDQRVTLILGQFSPGEGFKVSLLGKPIRPRSDVGAPEGDLRFGPNEMESEVGGTSGTAKDLPVLMIDGDQYLVPLTAAQKAARMEAYREGGRFAPPPVGQAREAAVTWLELTKTLRRDIRLETGPMDKPLAALRQCSWDTVRDWGLNVDQQKSLSRWPRPKNQPHRWITPDDYPTKMLMSDSQANVHFRLMIDATGKPTSCHIQQSTRPKEFDKVVCDVMMKRARFEPALDANGKPVPTYWVQTIRFRLG